MFDTILVPVDGSEPGWRALAEAVAITLREKGGATIQGLYVVDSAVVYRPYGLTSEDVVEGAIAAEADRLRSQMLRQGRSVLAEFARRAEAAGVRASTDLVEGAVGGIICHRAGLVDLVVLGRRPIGEPVSNLLFGSTLGTVVRCSPRPVLVAVGQPRPVSRVLVAYDGSARANDALEVVARAGWVQGAEVIVLGVVEPGRVGPETLDAAAAYLRDHQVQSSVLLLPEEHPAAAILRVAEQREVDLVALGGYGHGRFLEVFLGHTVNEVLRATSRPVLVCR